MTNHLVPLRIPTGWTIAWNVFTEVNPEEFLIEDYEHRWEFNEDLFQFENQKYKKILDLGWYPEFDPRGRYRLVLLGQHEEEQESYWDWTKPLVNFETRSITEIIIKTEEILKQISDDKRISK